MKQTTHLEVPPLKILKETPGWWLSPTPLKNDGVKVSWDDNIPNIWKVIIQSCSKPPTRSTMANHPEHRSTASCASRWSSKRFSWQRTDMTSSQTMASDLNGKFHEVSRGTTAATTTIESCDCLTDTYVTWGENLGILLVYIVLSPNLTVIHVDIHHITMVMSHTNIHKPCNFTIQLSDFITTTLCLILPPRLRQWHHWDWTFSKEDPQNNSLYNQLTVKHGVDGDPISWLLQFSWSALGHVMVEIGLETLVMVIRATPNIQKVEGGQP